MDDYEILAAERKAIWQRADAIHGGCFPGSAAWFAAKAAEDELKAWDAEHLEFMVERSRRGAEAKALKQAEFAKRDIFSI